MLSMPWLLIQATNPQGWQPEFFYGDRVKFDTWVSQMDMYFLFNSMTENLKPIFATTFLRGRAQHWVKPFLRKYLDSNGEDNADGVFKSYNHLKHAMKSVFGVSNEIATAVRVIQHLTQKTSTAEYAAKFQEYAQLTDWDDEALQVMYRRGLKEHVKDELMRDGRKIDGLGDLVQVTIDLDDKLYERAMERRYDSKVSGKAGYTPGYDNRNRGFNDNYNKPKDKPYYGPQPMELDVTEKGRKIRNSKGNRRPPSSRETRTCYGCGKPGHIARDCRGKNMVRREQFNMMQRRTSKSESSVESLGDIDYTRRVEERASNGSTEPLLDPSQGRGGCHGQQMVVIPFELQNQPRQFNMMARRVDYEIESESRNGHGSLHWRFCYQDSCQVHYSAKSGAGYWPQQPRGTLGATHRQDATLQEVDIDESCFDDDGSDKENQDPGWNGSWSPEPQEESQETTGLDTIEEDQDPEESSEEDSSEGEESDTDDDNEQMTFTVDAPKKLYDMIIHLQRRHEEFLPRIGGRRMLHSIEFDKTLDTLRGMAWGYPLMETTENLATAVTERPPIGSRMIGTGYLTPSGTFVSNELRNMVQHARALYSETQKIQERHRVQMWTQKGSRQVQAEASRHEARRSTYEQGKGSTPQE
ncbi:putative gag homologue [Cladosporium fulvum T-1 virus]|uniref:Gag polyprotein n=2 Tax=root TaxID=1 RepID=Q9UVC2_PASFU|nr:putative gag homologue [Cladosporium fulvum T-1 virus]AAF21677.1 gag polyprotein [Fulvia fulva]CAA77890.1 putative gag homologue [Cladosporium fulvum T-1 virus]